MKTATFKTTTLQFAFLFSLLILFTLGCSKNEDDSPNPLPPDGEVVNTDGITENDLDVYEGDLGLLVKTRGNRYC